MASVAIVSGALGTVNGATIDLTSSGFGTPVAALVIVGNGTVNGTRQDDAALSVGATDGTRQWASGLFSLTGQSTTSTRRVFRADSVAAISTAGADPLVRVSFNAWITDGVRLTVDTTTSLSRIIKVVLFSGVSAYCDDVDLGTGTSAINVTSPGFLSDLVLFGNASDTDGTSSSTRVLNSFGAAWYNGGTEVNRCWTQHSHTGQSTQRVNGELSEQYVAEQRLDSGLSWGLTCDNFDSSGFDLTPSANSFNDHVGYLAIGLTGSDLAWLGTIDTPTSAASDWAVTSPGHQPQLVLGGHSTHTAVDTPAQSAAAGAVGVFGFTDSAEFSVGASIEDNQGTTDNSSLTDAKGFHFDDDAGATDFQMDSPTLNANGWTFAAADIDVVDGTGRKGWAMSIGSVAGGPFPHFLRRRHTGGMVTC